MRRSLLEGRWGFGFGGLLLEIDGSYLLFFGSLALFKGSDADSRLLIYSERVGAIGVCLCVLR